MENLYKKTILVTGGTGFIGKPLCAILAKEQAQIFVLTRKLRPCSDNITYISSIADIGDKAVDIIINLAGEPIAQRWTHAVKEKLKSSRIDITKELIKYIETSPIKPSLLISASAIGYYGTNEQTAFSEDTLPTAQNNFSQQLCASWENEALNAQQYGVRTVLLRIGAVLAKDGGMLGKLLMPFKLGLGGPIGHGHQWLSWIDRDDLIRLILHIINTPHLMGPINATTPHPVSNEIFSTRLAQALRRPCFIRTPALVLRFIFGQMADEIMIEGQKVLPEKALASGYSFLYPHIHTSLEKIIKHG